ncbi:uncharacterized protein LOC103131247 [Poecilia formosa]|uniref:uncharacterized protein LOC103131247 n=1 Tax=Poecilia formosa TaxID=48698 RepID=UPI0004439079|nr:PREDICTED: uncharacterized protein LOC103131247 [Poecilia formosa]
MDRYNGKVHVYQIGSDQPGEQNQFYRTKMDENLLKTGDLSLTARWPTYEDSGTFTCRVSSRKGDVLMEKQVWLKVKVKQVEVESGEESVLLPWTITEDLDGDVRVEWTDVRDRVVHVYQNGSDQPEEQDQRYRTRTRMDENLLKNKDLSLTLSRPTNGDGGRYTCIVYNKKGDVLMEKQVQLEVKVQQVMVESGEESVLLSCRTTQSLDGDVRVEWRDGYNRKVHVYQNGSDQPGEQDQIYRTRTKMDENLLENKDLSLTLIRPTDGDNNFYTCRVYNKDGAKLMEKKIQLEVIVQQVLVEVKSGVESVKLPCRTTKDLDGDVRVVWRDGIGRKVHVYQNGSDQPEEQNQFYRTRTRMDKNPLKNKDLSLTLSWPRERDRERYICIVYNRNGDVLMKTQVRLQVKAGTDQDQPEDIREPLMVQSV